MKSFISNALLGICLVFTTGSMYAQKMQYFRPNDERGVNVFETSKEDTVGFDGLKVQVGGDFALQFQAITQDNDSSSLLDLGSDFNLPTANLNIDVQLQDGLRMHLKTYLSSRHHPEAWVKGGHIQIDKLDFIKEGFLSKFMSIATIRVGLDEFNYGDAHFRRTDNARAIFNPFVGNYIMDSFSTEAFGEITLQKNGFLFVGGLTNGKLNQSVVKDETTDNQPSVYGKLGYDKQLNDDLRVRLTGSFYMNYGTTTGTWLYGGDRAGSRYYYVMHTEDGGSDFSGRINARYTELTAIQINPFVKYKGLEFFGIFESATGRADGEEGYTQWAAELIYRFGNRENLYVGGRYNTVTGKIMDTMENQDATRVNFGAGWFITKNILAKAEYVMQKYEGDGWIGGPEQGGSFDGLMIEAVISF